MEGGWVREEVLPDADAFFDGLLAEVSGAAARVDLATYIFDDDGLGRRVAAALAGAARRGVRVRVLVDGVGSPDWPGASGRILAAAGAQAQVFHPLPWSREAVRRFFSHPSLAASILRPLRQRNHAKVCVVDGRSAWVGSANVSDRSLPSVRGAAAWRECGVRVEGPEVEVLGAAFAQAWERARDPWARLVDRSGWARRHAVLRNARLVRAGMSRALRKRNRRDLAERIARARRRVWLETPYFVPTPRLLWALRKSARRGAEVRIVLPRRSDVVFMPWIHPAFLVRLVPGVRVFEYMPSILHAKVTIVDDWCLVGSSNLNRRSLLRDLEIDVVLEAPRSREALETRFREDLARSEEVTSETLADRWRATRWIEPLLRPFRDWM